MCWLGCVPTALSATQPTLAVAVVALVVALAVHTTRCPYASVGLAKWPWLSLSNVGYVGCSRLDCRTNHSSNSGPKQGWALSPVPVHLRVERVFAGDAGGRQRCPVSRCLAMSCHVLWWLTSCAESQRLRTPFFIKQIYVHILRAYIVLAIIR